VTLDREDRYRMPYCDSSVFIASIQDEAVKGIRRGEISTHVLDLAERKTYKIYTSALTLAEVYKAHGSPSLPQDATKTFLEYCENEWIEIIDVTRVIGEDANRLCRQHNIRKPNDAIHLACALYAGCDVLLTWDHEDLLKLSPASIGIRIEEPRMLGQPRLRPGDDNEPQ